MKHVLIETFNKNNTLTLFWMLLLVPLNWALESLKWKQLAKPVLNISFGEAFKGILAGLAIGVAAPAQLGDTIGRVAYLKTDKRLHAIGAALISNGIQFYVSVLAGACGWFAIQDQLALSETTKGLLSVLLLSIACGAWVLLFIRTRLNHWHPKHKYLRKAHDYLRVIAEYSATDLLIATGYGVLRYLVFMSQFILALSLFNFDLTYVQLASCVSLIFLAKTLIPAVNVLGDLGLREFTALFVFKQYNLPVDEVITATFLIWIINILGPILIGIYLIWKYRLKNLNLNK